MKKTVAFFSMLFLANIGHSQNFGCYSTEAINSHRDVAYDAGHDNMPVNAMWNQWDTYTTSKTADSYYVEYYPDYPAYPKHIKMEGMIKNGKKQGKWRLYEWSMIVNYKNNGFYSCSFYTGNYIDGLKEGTWKEFKETDKNDTIVEWEATFLHNKLNGIVKKYTNSFVRYKTQYINDTLNGVATSYFRDGNIQSETTYKNGKKEGEEIEYIEVNDYENNNKRVLHTASINYYVNDSLSGLCIDFGVWALPKEEKIENYAHGKRAGKCIYLSEGFITQLGNYENDLLNGEDILYHDSGKKSSDIFYKNNIPYTVIGQYAWDGSELPTGNLKNGTGTLETYYDNGSLKAEYTYQDQVLVGPFREYDDSGRVSEEGYYDNEINPSKETVIKEHYPDGELSSIEVYPVNHALGYEYDTGYYKNGKIEWDGYTTSDKETEYVKSFYDNGNIEKEMHSKYDSSLNRRRFLFDGVQKYYFENGKLRAIVPYSMGIETGHSMFYDEDGNLMREHYIFSDSSEYNIFNKDTINRLDKYKRKQGKWISLPEKYNGEGKNNPCDIEPASVKYYKDGKPTGTWFCNPNSERFYCDSIKITWIDTVKAYYINYTAHDDEGGRVREEGYMLDMFFKIGTWKEFAITKKGPTYLEWEGEYINGLKEGIWKQYKKNGKLKSQVLYHKGYRAKENHKFFS